NSDMHVLPAIHLTYNDGVILKAWLAAGTDPRAAICGTTLEVGVGDVMASFSSRGANLSVADSFAEFKFKSRADVAS
ncbi:MAG: hypothetical protein U9Q83_03065, partial [Bacteroidota bacterium]|nr:hypothetical protein [Bacteroidota bacterium]